MLDNNINIAQHMMRKSMEDDWFERIFLGGNNYYHLGD